MVPRQIVRRGTCISSAGTVAVSTPLYAQQMSAVLNGVPIGTAVLAGAWSRVSFTAPPPAWQIGVNELELFLSSDVSPAQSGLGADSRQLSVAVDRLTIQSR